MKEAAIPAVQTGAQPRSASTRQWLEAAAITVLLGVMALATYNAVTTDRFAADLSITEFLQRADLGWLRGPLFWMGVRGVAGLFMAITIGWLWLRGYRLAAVFVVLMLIPDASSFILRDIFDRPRPDDGIVNVYGGAQGDSFPSGTALHWIFFGGIMVFLLPKVVASRRATVILSGLIALWVAAMGLWVIHHGRHWPSDVFGGYLYGLFYLALWIKLYSWAKAWEARHPELLNAVDRALRRAGSRFGLAKTP